MKVIPDGGAAIDLGTLEENPTVGIVDYSRRETDDFGVTTVVKRGFSRTMQMRFQLPFGQADLVERQLAALRATTAQWVADDRFAWLDFEGYYKDFSLDLNVPPTSFCTLTVNGLAETEAAADDGSDPAPTGSTSTLKLLQPVAVTDASLVSSTIAENDYAAWSSTTGYAAGQRVIVASTHRIYESQVNVSIGHDPTTDDGSNWIDVGPTNRWAMFDQTLGTITTTSASSIVIVLNALAVNAIALLDVAGTTVRVQATGYDKTHIVVGGTATFLDLPSTTGSITLTVSGNGQAVTYDDVAVAYGGAPVTSGSSSNLSVGTLLMGKVVSLGITEESPTSAITDYSRKDVDEFGAVTVVPRSWAKKMDTRALLSTDALDMVANRIASVRGTPALWIAQEGMSALTIYGFFKDFSIAVGQSVSTLSLSVEGLSEAAPLPTSLTDLLDSLRPLTQWSSDGLGGTGASAWHDTYVDGQDYFMRQSNDGGATWGPATPAIGLNTAQVLLFKRAATTPAVPSVDSTYTFATAALTGQNNGWTQVPPAANGQPCYAIAAFALSHSATDTIAPADWSAPAIFVQDGTNGSNGANGSDGLPGLSTAQIFLYQRAASAPSVPSGTATYTFATSGLTGINNGWSRTVPAADGNPLWVTVAAAVAAGATDTIASTDWASPVVMAQDGSAAGINNATVYLFKRAATTPALPSVTTTYTFATATLSGVNNGWTQTVPTSNGQPLWVTTAEALSGSSTDTIASSEWASPTVMAQDGSNGTPGTSPYAASLSASSVIVAADYTGATKTGELPKVSTLSVKQGTTDVPYSNITATLTSSDSAHIAASYNAANGLISITQADTTGYIDVAVSVSGTAIGTKRIAISRQLDPHPPASQTSAVGTLLSLYVNHTTNHTTPDVTTLILPASATGQLRGTLTGTYFSDWTGSGTQTCVLSGVAMYRVAGSGSGWTNFGAYVAGTTAQRSDLDDNFNGDLNIDQTVTGLTPGGLYEVGFAFKKSGGTSGTFATIGASYTLSQS